MTNEQESDYQDDPSAPDFVRFNRAKLELMRRVKFILKEKKAGVPYPVVDAAEVIAQVRPVMLELGFIWGPIGFKPIAELCDQYEVNGGKSVFRAVAVCRFRLTHVESGFSEEYEVAGEGADQADKRIGKVMTYAQKYALLQALMLETGLDDPDRAVPPPPKPKAPRGGQAPASAPPAERPTNPNPTPPNPQEMAQKSAAVAQKIGEATTDAELDGIARRVDASLRAGTFDKPTADKLSGLISERRALIRAGLPNGRKTEPAEPTGKKPAHSELTPRQRWDRCLYAIRTAKDAADVQAWVEKANSLYRELGSNPETLPQLTGCRNAARARLDMLEQRSPQFVSQHDLMMQLKGGNGLLGLAERLANDETMSVEERGILIDLAKRRAAESDQAANS